MKYEGRLPGTMSAVVPAESMGIITKTINMINTMPKIGRELPHPFDGKGS